jgi:hypothetical protein
MVVTPTVMQTYYVTMHHSLHGRQRLYQSNDKDIHILTA